MGEEGVDESAGSEILNLRDLGVKDRGKEEEEEEPEALLSVDG